MKLLKRIDDNLLKWLLVIFVFFIPLYPKFPFHIVNYTYIAIRLDDFFVALISGVFLIQILRGKIKWREMLFLKPIVAFWGIVFLSFVSGLYLTHTIDYPLVGFLNAARRVEYMVVFFIAAQCIRTIKDFRLILYSLFGSLLLVDLYGIGQRFFNFPAISTMNPEFAKGQILYLTEDARLSSTFAGHYDLGAYLVFLMPLLWGLVMYGKRVIGLVLILLSAFILTLTASRASSMAYLISTLGFLIYFRKVRYAFFVIVLAAGLAYLNTDLLQRWLKTVQIRQIVLNELTGEEIVVQNIQSDKLAAGTSYVKIRDDKDSTASSLLKDDLIAKASLSGGLNARPEGRYETVSAVTTYIFISTRLQISWPRARDAFFRNPLLGTGPSSITESSDGDYMRWLGETGILGFGAFLSVIFVIVRKIYGARDKLPPAARALPVAILFGTFGLLINATLIDIFEASKVAYTFWLTLGIFVGLILLDKKELKTI